MAVETTFVCHMCKIASYCGRNASVRMKTVLKKCVDNHKFNLISGDSTYEKDGKLFGEGLMEDYVIYDNWSEYEQRDIEDSVESRA